MPRTHFTQQLTFNMKILDDVFSNQIFWGFQRLGSHQNEAILCLCSFFYSLFCFLRLKTSLHLLELFPKNAALLPHCQKWMVNRLFYFSVNYSSKGETVSFIPLTLSHRVKIEKQLTMGMPAWVHCANCLFVFVLIWKVSHYLIVLSNSVALSVGKSRPRKSVDS